MRKESHENAPNIVNSKTVKVQIELYILLLQAE